MFWFFRISYLWLFLYNSINIRLWLCCAVFSWCILLASRHYFDIWSVKATINNCYFLVRQSHWSTHITLSFCLIILRRFSCLHRSGKTPTLSHNQRAKLISSISIRPAIIASVTIHRKPIVTLCVILFRMPWGYATLISYQQRSKFNFSVRITNTLAFPWR